MQLLLQYCQSWLLLLYSEFSTFVSLQFSSWCDASKTKTKTKTQTQTQKQKAKTKSKNKNRLGYSNTTTFFLFFVSRSWSWSMKGNQGLELTDLCVLVRESSFFFFLFEAVTGMGGSSGGVSPLKSTTCRLEYLVVSQYCPSFNVHMCTFDVKCVLLQLILSNNIRLWCTSDTLYFLVRECCVWNVKCSVQCVVCSSSSSSSRYVYLCTSSNTLLASLSSHTFCKSQVPCGASWPGACSQNAVKIKDY